MITRPAPRPAPRPRQLLALLAATLPLALLGMAAPAQARIVISQVYGGGGNSGATYKNDFIEIFNNATQPVNLNGWAVQYASSTGSTWQVTQIGNKTIPAGGYLLIQQAAGTGGSVDLPAFDVLGTIPLSGSAGKVALTRSITALTGTTPSGGDVADAVAYGSGSSPIEGSPTGGTTNATAALRLLAGCTDTNVNLNDFAITAPTPRNSATPVAVCNPPGPEESAPPPPPPPPPPPAASTPIAAIQGSGGTSPLLGQSVITGGVVTRLMNNGFFLQDPIGDGNPATSEGLFVFTSSAPTVSLGQQITLAGQVAEFSTGGSTVTQLSSPTAITVVGSGNVVTPTAITLPLANAADFERYEGMLVTIAGPLTVQQNYFQARYGQLTLGAGGRHENPTNKHRPGSAEAIALASLQARSRFLLDDGSSLQNANPTAYFGSNGLPRAGDTVGSVTGTLDFGPATAASGPPGLYRLQATTTPSFTASNPRPATPPAVGGNIRVASMNVLNYFTTLGSAGRGATNVAEFTRQKAKIVVALAAMDADAVGLMEIENNGDGSGSALQDLLTALNATVGAGTYAAVPDPVQGTGSDQIKVAMIYKPARLARSGASVSDTDPVNSRPTLAQTFAAANGERFTVVVNHLKSKGSCPASGADADQGDGQGCWNALRTEQAQRLRTFVAQLQSNSGSNDVLVIGDMNAYGQEDPIFALTSAGYVDQMSRFNSLAYSYVFDGTAGRLDHGITTATLSPKVASAAYWHIDADEQLAHDYNLEFKQPACALCAPDPFDASLPYRASDHDPALLGLNIYKTLLGTAARDRLIGTPGDDIIVGGVSADTVTGGAGADIFVVQTLRDIGDIVTDFAPGADRIDLRQLLAGLGYAGTNPVADGRIRFRAVAAGTSVDLDPDGPAGAAAYRSLLVLSGVQPASLQALRDLIAR